MKLYRGEGAVTGGATAIAEEDAVVGILGRDAALRCIVAKAKLELLWYAEFLGNPNRPLSAILGCAFMMSMPVTTSVVMLST